MIFEQLALLHLPREYAFELNEVFGSIAKKEAPYASKKVLANALHWFSWSKTKQGSSYWMKIYEHLREGGPLPPLPACESEPIRKTPDQAKTQTNNDMLNKYATTPVATPTLIYGTDVSSMDEASVMSAIKGLKAEIKDLLDSGITSRRVDELIAGKTAAVAKLIERLDSFATTPATPAS
jgi:hypothetical protein